jgi:hypothetical protein
MTIRADPDAIRRFAAAVADSSLHAAAAREYMLRYGDLPPEAVGLIALFRGTHDRFVTTLGVTLSRISNVLRASGQELSLAADYYATASADVVAMVDATYPESPRNTIAPI